MYEDIVLIDETGYQIPEDPCLSVLTITAARIQIIYYAHLYVNKITLSLII